MSIAINISEDQFTELDRISTELEAYTNELNNKLLEIENKLTDRKVGVSAWSQKVIKVSVPQNNGDSTREDYYRVGYCRVKPDDKWRIVVQKLQEHKLQTGETQYKPVGTIKPLLHSPRIVRMNASPLLEDLVQKLVEKSKKFLEDIDASNKSLVIDIPE